MLATYPHQNANLDGLIIYQRVSHEIVDGILRRSSKAVRSSQTQMTGQVRSKQSHQLLQPLKQALEIERLVLVHCIEKISALDASDLKMKARKGSTYPLAEQKGKAINMQSVQDHLRELNMRFLTDKELKNCLLLEELFAYIHKRIVHF